MATPWVRANVIDIGAWASPPTPSIGAYSSPASAALGGMRAVHGFGHDSFGHGLFGHELAAPGEFNEPADA